MVIGDYIRILRKGWLLIVAFTVVGLASSALYSLTKTPLYTASSVVFVSTQTSGTVQDLAQGNTFTTSRVKTYAKLATTPTVLDPVIESLRLKTTAAGLAASVDVSAQLETTLIDLTVTNADPELAARLANEIAASLTRTVGELESTADGADDSPVRLERVQAAVVPTAPGSPNVPLNMALGLLIGLVVGVAAASLRERLDHRIRAEKDVAEITDRPIVGGIAFDPKAAERPLIVHDDPRGPRSETFRVLRTNLQFLDVREGRTFVVTSSIEGEGKSTTSINLAIALADSESRVALIDADMRRPSVDKYMGIEGGVGLTDVLIGRVPLEDALQPWGDHGLTVLPAGTLPPNPSELLGSTAMAALIEELERDFDIILFDAPPLLPVTDAAILAASTSGVILVVAAGKTTRGQLTSAVSVLENVGEAPSGIVLNMLPTTGPDAYAYGHYGYTGAATSTDPAPLR